MAKTKQTKSKPQKSLYSLKYFELPDTEENTFSTKAIKAFVASVSMEIIKIENQFETNDIINLKHTVHKLKSSLHMFGIHGADKSIIFLENTDESASGAKLGKKIAELILHLDQCLNAMKEELGLKDSD